MAAWAISDGDIIPGNALCQICRLQPRWPARVDQIDDKTARLWDPATGQEIRHLRMATAQAVQAAQAAHTARTIIKSRARTFALIPALLENIEPKLSILTPRQMAARAAQLFREEITAPRWIGFGGDGYEPKDGRLVRPLPPGERGSREAQTSERSRPLRVRMP